MSQEQAHVKINAKEFFSPHPFENVLTVANIVRECMLSSHHQEDLQLFRVASS